MAEKICSKCGQYKAIHPYFFNDGDLCYNCYFEKRNFVLLSHDWYLNYHCQKHPNKILKTTSYDVTIERKPPSCPTCNREEGARKRFIKTSSNNSTSITLRQHLRNISKRWRMDSKENDKNRCQLTGITENLQIHHPTSFETLCDILCSKIGISPFSFCDYELCEFNRFQRKNIDDLWISILYGHGLGITLARPVHRLFHNIFKRKNVRPQHFEEFKERFLSGEYSNKFYYYPTRDKWLLDGIPESFIEHNFKLFY